MNLISYTSVIDKKKLLQSFDSSNSLWIVSDIKSRDFVREHIRKHKKAKGSQNLKKERSVQRAQDFWRKSLSLARPEITVVSRSFLIFIYQEWARHRPLKWQRGIETATILCQYMEMTAHLLEHPLQKSLIEEWQSEKGGPNLSKWQNLAGEFWSYLNQPSHELTSRKPTNCTIKTQKIIEESWVSAFLIDHFPNLKPTGNEKSSALGGLSTYKEEMKHKDTNQNSIKEVVFDLGFEMDAVEAELIKQIANKIPTKVLIPSHQGKKEPPINYKTFYSQGATFVPLAKNALKPTKIQIKKWATPLAEVKDISAYVSELLRQGVSAHKISVVAPHIEDYWIFLKSHFKKENISINKRETVSLVGFYETQLWLSAMWTHLSVIQYENMEALLAQKNPYQNFSRLKSHFYNVKEKEHWPSALYTNHLLRDKNQAVSIKEFIKWALALLLETKRSISTTNERDFEKKPLTPSPIALLKKNLDHFAKQMSVTPFSEILPYSSWIKLLEIFLRLKESLIKKEESGGLNCLSFNALSYLEVDFVYVAGLSEQNLKTGTSSLLSFSESDFLSQSLGFFLKYEPVDKMEQVISHFIDQDKKEVVLSFSNSDFEGVALNPSFLWLKKAKEQGFNIQQFSSPQDTFWKNNKKKLPFQIF